MKEDFNEEIYFDINIDDRSLSIKEIENFFNNCFFISFIVFCGGFLLKLYGIVDFVDNEDFIMKCLKVFIVWCFIEFYNLIGKLFLIKNLF